MHKEQRQKIRTRLSSAGLKQALFSHPESVTWLTGFAPPVELGGHQFAGGPALVWYEDGHFTLIILDALGGFAEKHHEQADVDVLTYPAYAIDRPITPHANLADVFTTFLKSVAGGGQVGLERHTLPLFLYQILDQTLNPKAIEGIDGWVAKLRIRKTAQEIAILRRTFALTDVGHAAARQAVAVGMREIDVWGATHAAMNSHAGHRVPLGNDCIVTDRKGEHQNIGGWPLDYPIREDSALIVDLSTRVDGYWSDSCATYYPQSPTALQVKLHRIIEEALAYAISLIKPGAVANEIDAKVRAFIEWAGYPAYIHHTGHGVGVGLHEEPRIVPYNDMPLEPDMIVMLEPGIYIPDVTGIRLEDAVLVTHDGAEVLTKHDKSI